MFFAEGQSGESEGMIGTIAEAVGNVPWFVVAILFAMILTGVIVIALRLKSGADDHRKGPTGGSAQRRPRR